MSGSRSFSFCLSDRCLDSHSNFSVVQDERNRKEIGQAIWYVRLFGSISPIQRSSSAYQITCGPKDFETLRPQISKGRPTFLEVVMAIDLLVWSMLRRIRPMTLRKSFG